MQGHSFWLAVWLNMGLRVRFLYPTPDDCALGPLVQHFYWLANQSHVFRGLDPHRRKRLKSWFRSEGLKAGSTDGRLGAFATLFTTTASLPRVLNLTVPSDISLLKLDSGLAVITSQLITELKALVVVVIVVHDSFFYHCIINRCYLQLLTSVPNILN